MFPLGDNATLEATHTDFFGDEIEVDMSNITTTYPIPSTPNIRICKDHSLDHVIGDIQSSVLTRRMTKTSNEQGFISTVYEEKTHEDLHTYPSWIEAMQDEYLQFEIQKVWTLVDLPYRKRAIRTKWVYMNKKDKRGIVIRNKARLVVQDFVVYQMDEKSAFLYGKIKVEVYVCQPLGFEDPEFPDRVYKVEKALYGLHQAPRACSMGELTFFLGLQVSQKDDGIFISQDKYVDEILKKFSFSTVKTASTPMEASKQLLKDAEAEDVDVHLYRSMTGSLMYLIASRPDIMFVVCACARFQVTPKVSHLYAVKRIFRYWKGQPKLGLWYPKDSPFDLEAYTDSDYAGASLDRKSTTGGYHSWKQIDFMIYIDNESTICIVKNLVFYSKTKHIEIRHHFIRDTNKKKLIQMSKIHTDHNVADLLTKAFDVGIFQYLIATNETVIKEWEDRMERAATTASSLEAEQDSGNINRTQSMTTLNESFPQGTNSSSGPRCQDTILGDAEA
ncbi:putative ribonuclease H-like domain-containing protein [Tanacetum coccineum]